MGFRYTFRMDKNGKFGYIFTITILLCSVLTSSCAQEVQRSTAPIASPDPIKIVLKTDSDSITAGRTLFMQKCSNCHYINNDEYFAGPSLRGILKNPLLPISKRPATPENIVRQMRHPYTDMPSFVFFYEDDLMNILAFLNSL